MKNSFISSNPSPNPIDQRGSALLTSTAAAEVLGVAVSTLKRWADDGTIAHVRTAGGHRRFHRDALKASGLIEADDETQQWIHFLLSDSDSYAVVGELRMLRGRCSSWREASSFLARVTMEIGRRWRNGDLFIHQEHQATEKLTRAIAQCSDSIPLAPSAPVCVLAVPEQEEHSLGLALLEPCLRELGWRTRWLGRKTPASEVVAVVKSGGVHAVALSASANCRDASYLKDVALRVGRACQLAKIPLWLGGAGAWPSSDALFQRLTSLDELEARAKLIRHA